MIQKAKLLGMALLEYLKQPTQQQLLYLLCYQTPPQLVNWSRALAALSLDPRLKKEPEREG